MKSRLGVDLLVICRAAGVLFIDETFPASVIPETVHLASTAQSEPRPDGSDSRRFQAKTDWRLVRLSADSVTKRSTSYMGIGIRVGIGQVTEQGSRLIVSFSVISSKSETIELVPPQVQLAGQTKSGLFRRARWTTVQQLPVAGLPDQPAKTRSRRAR